MNGHSMVRDRAARTAFDAWGVGEATGNYSAFRALLSPEFDHYSHPMLPARGVHRGAAALTMIETLMAGREAAPNSLTFSNVVQTRSIVDDDAYVFLFDSAGEVAGGYPYDGYNAIALTLDSTGLVRGFREYFGDVDPTWFQ